MGMLSPKACDRFTVRFKSFAGKVFSYLFVAEGSGEDGASKRRGSDSYGCFNHLFERGESYPSYV
jgi:hypothetical protein